MTHPTRILLAAALAAMAWGMALAQTQAAGSVASPAVRQEPAAPSAAGRANQTIERIRTEDAGSRIDELRVGGETQQITVQPKTSVPSYEVRPAEGARGAAPANSSGDTNGARVWNLLKF